MENQTLTEQSRITFNLTPEFKTFHKIPRLYRDVVIQEKIDGTNACICITDQGGLYAGKRTSWCTPEKDNYGFATWCQENKTELFKLGPGRHFGEWWGLGIQRGYGLKEKRFSLFDTDRDRSNDPKCISYVPVLYSGVFDSDIVRSIINKLRTTGSMASPGWMTPEGIIVVHKASGQRFKVTCQNDETPKGILC